MNRISTWDDARPTAEAIQQTLAADLSATTANSSTAFTTFVPLHYEKKYAYPLLVWLHGAGDNESQLRQVMPLVSLRNHLAVAPRAASMGELDGEECYQWTQSTAGTALATQRVFYCIDLAMSKYNVAPARIFLAGHGDGGTMALRIGLAHPDKFAGVASFGGALPAQRTPLCNLNQARRLNVLVAQGRRSLHYDEVDFCNDLRLLHYAGMSTTFRQYPCGDVLTSKMLQDLDAWIMEIVTGEHAAAQDSSILWSTDL